MSCSSLTDWACPLGDYFNFDWFCDGTSCVDARDRSICCQPAQHCVNSTVELCDHGYISKLVEPNVTEAYCNGSFCTFPRDRSLCCNNADPCNSLTCPRGFTTLPNTFCGGIACNPDRDEDLCCRPKAPCTALQGRDCPFGHFFNTTDFCNNVTCVEDIDRPHCCQPAESCANFTCPFSYQIKPNETREFCNGLVCGPDRDLLLCCDVADPCANLPCPHGFTEQDNITSKFCLGPACDVDRDRDVCCEPAAPCSVHYKCPHGWTLMPNTYCDGVTCEVERDLDLCCDPAMPCTNLTCPRNYVHTPNVYCDGITCVPSRDLFDCCELGVPLQYIKFTPLQIREISRDDNNRPVIQLAELTLYFHEVRVKIEELGQTISLGGDTPQNEQAKQATDGNILTKWLDYKGKPFEIQFSEAEKMDVYTLTTANDAPARDAIAWKLEGSYDGILWVLLHEVPEPNGEVSLARLTETEQFPIAVPCLAPRADAVANGAAVACEEGNLIANSSSCTGACAPGYNATPPELFCNGGLFVPEFFVCT